MTRPGQVLAMAETNTFKQGDKVSWNTSQGKTHGKVVKKLTADTHVKGTKITASESDPRYLVESDKTGEEAAHKRDALERRS
jgi:Hypervirulence associated proteins TUDOR domain